MIILLYGPDSFRRSQKLKEIIKNYKQKQSLFSVEFFDLKEDEELPRLKDFINQQLIFEGKKMAVIENAFGLDDKNLKVFNEFLKINAKNENVVLVISDDNELPKELEFLLEDAFSKQEFSNLDGEKIKFFIKSESKKRGIEFSDSAINFLAVFFKDNTWGLVTEIDKLEFFYKPGKKIDISDIEKAGEFFDSPNMFNFVNAVSRNWHSAEKLKSLEGLFLSHEDLVKVFNILASRPFLKFELVKKMADYDVLIKSGLLDYETALLDLCF
ncbi:MAG: hypothetical protein WC596_04665 [Candidatus Shapirobacteria bacterium]